MQSIKEFSLLAYEKFILYPTDLVLDKRSDDITQKLLLELEDKSLIETVLISAPKKVLVKGILVRRCVFLFK